MVNRFARVEKTFNQITSLPSYILTLNQNLGLAKMNMLAKQFEVIEMLHKRKTSLTFSQQN